MRHKSQYSAQARKDLDEIWDYIVADLGNSIATEKTANRMKKRIMDRMVSVPEQSVRRTIW